MVGFVFGPVVGIIFAVAVVIASPRSRSWTIEALLRDRLGFWIRRLAAGERIDREVVAALLGLGGEGALGTPSRVGRRTFRCDRGWVYRCPNIVYRHASLYQAVADGLAVGLAVGLAAGFFTISLKTTPSEVRFLVARKGLPIFLRHLAIGLASGVGVGVVAGALLGS